MRSKPKELYEDADAVTLNLEKPTTRWFNMGWWTKHGQEPFAEAAAEHCRQVAFAAQLQPGKRILEVGYGSGDSTLLLAEEFPPSSYIGFTSLAAQQALTTAERAEAASHSRSQFRLLQGDAAHCLSSLPPSSVDAILAVDCAYHFSPRTSFLRSALPLLSSPSARLALSDLLLPSTPLSLLDSVLLRLLCFAANLPFSNLHTPADYRKQLVQMGYAEDSIKMREISEKVWPGFIRFVERREKALGGVLGSKWTGLRMYAKVVQWYSGYGGGTKRLGFWLISAGREANGQGAESKKEQ
ncbi:hypothetical protein JCM11251_003422 [Rhodosporidiobolus azoricus]